MFPNAPDVLTQLRYYFVADDTPVYPGFHHYDSANWTADKEAPYVPPLLGQDASMPVRWLRGHLGTDHPPAVVVGSAACVADGEVYPPAVEGRRLIAGVDSRCWTEAGLPLPDQIPVLWLKDVNLVPLTNGAAVVKWKDAAVVPNDTLGPLTPVTMQVGNLAGRWLCVNFDGDLLPLSRSISLEGDFALLAVVVNIILAGAGPAFVYPASPVTNASLIRLSAANWTVRPSTGPPLSVPNPVGLAGTHLWSVRCESGLLTLQLDGAQVGQVQLQPGGSFRVVWANSPGFGGGGFWVSCMGELKVYDNWLSQAQYDSDVAAIKAYWAIP